MSVPAASGHLRYASLLKGSLVKLDAEVAKLHQGASRGALRFIDRMSSVLASAHSEPEAAAQRNLQRFSLLLAELAEAYSYHERSSLVLDRLARAALAREAWVSNPISVLITSGEYYRRSGHFTAAAERFSGAIGMLEAGESQPQTHQELGRLFYEIAYLHRLRGDAAAASSALQRSEVECDLAGDAVGREIARALLAVVLHEEGHSATAADTLRDSLQAFEELSVDAALTASGRAKVARRWTVSARFHLAQACLGCGNVAAARELVDSQLHTTLSQPSLDARVTATCIDAQIHMASGALDLATASIARAQETMNSMRTPLGEKRHPNNVERAAMVPAVAGALQALAGSPGSIAAFEAACQLEPNQHNRRAQAIAWAGRAMLALESAQPAQAMSCIRAGLKLVDQCGAPVRSFLLDLLRDMHRPVRSIGTTDLSALISRYL